MIIIDTNVILQHPSVISDFEGEQLVVPICILKELDALKHRDNEELAYQARRGIQAIENAGREIDFPECEGINGADEQLLFLTEKMEGQLLTNDLSLKVRALAKGLMATSYHNGREVGYRGWRTLVIGEGKNKEMELYAQIQSNPEENSLELLENEYLIVETKDEQEVSKRSGKKNNKVLEIFKWQDGKMKKVLVDKELKIKPWNALQNCALDLLLDTKVPVKFILSPPGAGKSLLSVSVGYHLQQKGIYDKLIFIRNADTDERGNVGYLKGDLEEKTAHLFQPLIDCFPHKDITAEKMLRHEELEMYVKVFLKGLTLNGFLIVDESEDLTFKDLIRIGTRVGDRGGVVFIGDRKQSVGLYEREKALEKAIQVLKGNPLVGVVVLQEDVRSNASRLFAELM